MSYTRPIPVYLLVVHGESRNPLSDILALIIILVAAIGPTVVYCIAFYWADRYEREPRSLIVTAFVWGAIPSVVVSLLGELALGSPFVADANTMHAALVEGVVVAPIIEEIAKAAALLGFFLWKRNEFDGVLDGLIYGALIGFGFAMTENILYFISSYDEGGFASLSWTIFLRSVIFGLNHAFYTSLTGIGFGMARNKRSWFTRVAWMMTGLTAAILVHAIHNFGVTISDVYPIGFLLSMMLAACGLGLVIAAVVMSWRHERSVIQVELAEELGNVLSTNELITLTGRWRQPLRSQPNDKSERMSLYVELAVRKRRLRALGTEHEASLISEIEQIRARLKDNKAESG